MSYNYRKPIDESEIPDTLFSSGKGTDYFFMDSSRNNTTRNATRSKKPKILKNDGIQ